MSIQTAAARQSRLRVNGAPHSEGARPHVNGVVPARKRKTRAATDRITLLPSFHSEPTREVLMQTATGRRADRLTVAYNSSEVDLELSARGETLLSGAVESELVIDGESLVARGDWQAAAWYSDADCDYLELQLFLPQSVRIDRQLLLARHDHFALLADAVIAPQAKRIQYCVRLPVAEGQELNFDSPTRECRLSAERQATRVFPLGLPQSRTLGSSGSFLHYEDRLELRHAAAGAALYAPVLLDWHPRRQRVAADWRSLTVSENCQAVGSDRAAGCRLRMGKFQLLIYRSLAPTDEARAVLGHHTRYETVVGMFDSSGDVDPLVMVEAESVP